MIKYDNRVDNSVYQEVSSSEHNYSDNNDILGATEVDNLSISGLDLTYNKFDFALRTLKRNVYGIVNDRSSEVSPDIRELESKLLQKEQEVTDLRTQLNRLVKQNDELKNTIRNELSPIKKQLVNFKDEQVKKVGNLLQSQNINITSRELEKFLFDNYESQRGQEHSEVPRQRSGFSFDSKRNEFNKKIDRTE